MCPSRSNSRILVSYTREIFCSQKFPISI